MMNYELLADLHPKKLTGIAIKKTQGKLVLAQVIPERPSAEMSGYYKTYNDVYFGGMTPEVGEGVENEYANTSYAETSYNCHEYREGGRITERAIKFLLAKNSTRAVANGRALVEDEIQFLTERLMLREENLRYNALVNNAYSSNTVAASNVWSGTTGTPIDDIRRAVRNIRDNWHVEADTLIIGTAAEEALMNHADVKDLVKYTNTAMITGNTILGLSKAIGRFLGLDVLVSDVVTGSGIASPVTETKMVNTTAIVCKRGMDLGAMWVAEPLEVRRWQEMKSRSVEVQIFKTMVPVVFRTRQIALITSVVT